MKQASHSRQVSHRLKWATDGDALWTSAQSVEDLNYRGPNHTVEIFKSLEDLDTTANFVGKV